MTKREDHSDLKIPLQRNHPEKLETHNMPTDDVKNADGTNYGVDKPQNILRRKERIPQESQRHTRTNIYRLTHPRREKNEIEISSYGLD